MYVCMYVCMYGNGMNKNKLITTEENIDKEFKWGAIYEINDDEDDSDYGSDEAESEDILYVFKQLEQCDLSCFGDL